MEEGSQGDSSATVSNGSEAATQEAALSSSSPSSSSPNPPPPSSSPQASDASAPFPAPASSSSSSSRRLPAADDCCICFNGDSEDNDPILFCDGDGCTAVVHQSCYGVVSIPDGDWYCDMCAVKRDRSLASHPTLLTSFNRCLLCHHRDGAFKRSDSGHWVHAACAIWTPETGFADAERVDTVIGIDSIDRNRWRLICDVCGVKGGTCVQCLGSACRWSAHVLCAWKAGYRLELAAVGAGEELDVVKLIYCDRHRYDEYVKGRGGGRRGVRLNDSALSAAAASPAALGDGPGRGRRRGQDAPLEPAGYRCIRCGSRSRQHECSRQAQSEVDAEALETADAEQEVEDEELQQLYERTLKEETEEERKEREEQEAEEEALWEAEREEMDREKEERRRQERERREKERSDAAAARVDAAIGAGTATAAVVLSVAGSEAESLYEEMKRAQEQLEDGDVPTDEDAEQPRPKKRRRKAAVDETYTQAGAGGGAAVQGGKRRGRPPGSKTRVRRCLQHTEVGSRCPSNCPGRPPPYTEEELKEREEKQRRNSNGEVVRRRRKSKTEEEKMMTSAPGQRKLLRETRQTTAEQQQQQTPVSAHVITSPTAASAASAASSSPPSSSSSSHSPPSIHPPAHPQPVVVHPIPPPPIAVVPPLSSSPSAVQTRPDRPLAYNPNETEDIAQRVQTLLSCSSPPQQMLLLRQLLLDSPVSYFREVERRIRAEQGMDVLVRWMQEARAVSAWGLLSVLMEALHRMCSRQWEVEPALVREIVEEVTRSRAAVSEALRRNAEKLWTKLLDLGVVTEPQLKAKDDSSSSSSSSSMLAALNAQLATITQPSAAESGEADGIAAGVKKRKLMLIPSLSSPSSAAAEQKQDRSVLSLHPSPAEVKAAMERQRGREGLRNKRQQGAAPALKPGVGVAVSAVSKYRQQQAREAEELKRRERAMEREYQAGIEQQQQLSLLQHQQHLHHNGAANHHDAYQQQQQSLQSHLHLPYPSSSQLPSHFPSAAQGINDALAAANELMGHLRQAAFGSSALSALPHLSASSSSSSALHPHSSPVEAASLALQQLQKLRQLTNTADGDSPSAAGGRPDGGGSNGHSAGSGLLNRMVSSVSETIGWAGGNSR